MADKGSVLLAVLLAAAFIALLFLGTGHFAYLLVQMQAGRVHALRARVQAENRVLYQAGDADLPTTAGRLVYAAAEGSTGKHQLHRRLYLMQSMSDEKILTAALIVGSDLEEPAAFPIIDYEQLFMGAANCDAATFGSKFLTSSGFELTPSALRSSRKCVITRLPGDDDYAVKGNLEIQAAAQISAGGRSSAVVIAALGYLEAFEALTVSGKVMLVAGGDLHLKSLVSEGEAVEVTLVSSSGVVVVDQILGVLALRVITWSGAYLPFGYVPSGNNLLPPLLKREVLGMG
ncbi:MAG: hypothetical protein GX589_02055 [Deltaproteobacteria bacterium]|nr:hypothetical protein [Deltaproteobacteria bacterium]